MDILQFFKIYSPTDALVNSLKKHY